MAQSVNSSFSSWNSDPGKALDFAFVIAGWPTVYTVAKGDYSIPGSGDFAQFSSVRAWASAPKGAAAKVKGRPEEGRMTIGEMEVTVQDRVESGARSISDLVSRPAYLLGVESVDTTQLNGGIDDNDTTITVDDASGFPSSGQIFIGQECINYTGTTATTFTGCTRGYRLTFAGAHADNVKVYGSQPTLDRQFAYIYKGYQQLGLDKWEREYFGVLNAEVKDPGSVTFSILSATEQMRRVIGRPVGIATDKAATLNTDFLGFDFSVVINVNELGNLNNGHYLLRLGPTWAAIRSAV